MSIQELTVFEAPDKPRRSHFENRNAGTRLPRYSMNDPSARAVIHHSVAYFSSR
jgi:hypothetical protein